MNRRWMNLRWQAVIFLLLTPRAGPFACPPQASGPDAVRVRRGLGVAGHQPV